MIKLGYVFSISFIAAIAYLYDVLVGDQKIMLALYYGIINGLIMLFTIVDKAAARQGKQRVSELRFYVLSLLGGWFGGYIMQQWCRHKTQKQPFRAIYWTCAFIHSISAFLLLYIKYS